MSKKFIIILISVVLGLFLVSLVSYYFILRGNGGGSDSGIVATFRGFLPFGGSDNPSNNNNQTGEENPFPENEIINPEEDFTKKVRKLSSEPVAGAGVSESQAGTVVRYIEKATGHIYEVEMFSPRNVRISNTTIPVVYDAIWGNSNNSLITRYLKNDDTTVDTYSLTVRDTSTSTENVINGLVFPDNITNVSVLGSSVFYLQRGSTGSVGYTSNFSLGNRKVIWDSSLKELLSQYVNSRTVSLTTKPYPNIPGFMYFVDTSNASVRKILGNISGLSTITNPGGSYVFLLEQGNPTQSYIFDIARKTQTTIGPTTFPEKCVWSKKDVNVFYCAVPKEYLDENSLTFWYLGYTSLTDDIWKYDVESNTSEMISDLRNDSGVAIDVIKPILGDDEDYLIFMNKKDNILWSLDLRGDLNN